MALNTQAKDALGSTFEDGATKRSYSNRDSTMQPEEDIAQIRKRVLEANNALRASGLAWSSEPEGEEVDDDEEEEEDEEEDDEEAGAETNDKALPPAPTAATITHVWVLSSEQSDGYNDESSDISGVFRQFDDAVQKIIPEVRGYGFGEDEDDEMYFKDDADFIDIALKDGDNYTWCFQGKEGGIMSFELKKLPIL